MEKRIIRDTRQLPITLYLPLPHETPEQAAAMSSKADGVIVGSAIVKLVEQHGRNAAPYVYEFVRSIRTAIDRSAQTQPQD